MYARRVAVIPCRRCVRHAAGAGLARRCPGAAGDHHGQHLRWGVSGRHDRSLGVRRSHRRHQQRLRERDRRRLQAAPGLARDRRALHRARGRGRHARRRRRHGRRGHLYRRYRGRLPGHLDPGRRAGHPAQARVGLRRRQPLDPDLRGRVRGRLRDRHQGRLRRYLPARGRWGRLARVPRGRTDQPERERRGRGLGDRDHPRHPWVEPRRQLRLRGDLRQRHRVPVRRVSRRRRLRFRQPRPEPRRARGR